MVKRITAQVLIHISHLNESWESPQKIF